MNEHLASLLHQLRVLPIQPPPSPWKRVASYAVGGLTEIGFANQSDLVLVVSSNGRGVFDCTSGERLARDDDTADWWYDPVQLQAAGIGPLDGQFIRLAGLHGGGLPLSTRDGWSLWLVAPD